MIKPENFFYNVGELVKIYAKLVFGKSGGYIFMSVGIYIGIDAESYVGFQS